MFCCEFFHIVFPRKLGLSINRSRICNVKFCVRLCAFAVKHVICGKLYHFCLHFCCNDRQISGSQCIYFKRLRRIFLTGTDIRHTGTIDDNVRAVHLAKTKYFICIRHIKVIHICI